MEAEVYLIQSRLKGNCMYLTLSHYDFIRILDLPLRNAAQTLTPGSSECTNGTSLLCYFLVP